MATVCEYGSWPIVFCLLVCLFVCFWPVLEPETSFTALFHRIGNGRKLVSGKEVVLWTYKLKQKITISCGIPPELSWKYCCCAKRSSTWDVVARKSSQFWFSLDYPPCHIQWACAQVGWLLTNLLCCCRFSNRDLRRWLIWRNTSKSTWPVSKTPPKKVVTSFWNLQRKPSRKQQEQIQSAGHLYRRKSVLSIMSE